MLKDNPSYLTTIDQKIFMDKNKKVESAQCKGCDKLYILKPQDMGLCTKCEKLLIGISRV